MNDHERRAGFDAVVSKLRACKGTVDTILAEMGQTSHAPPFVMDRLYDARVHYEEARQEYEEFCSRL